MRTGVKCAFASGCLVFALALPARAGTGWDLLLAGAPPSKAEPALRADLDLKPGDAGAAYGLALLQQARGEREKAIVTALDGLRNAPGDPLAFLLEDLVGDDVAFNKATARLVGEALPLLVAREEMDPLVRFNLNWLGFQLAARTGERKARLDAMARAGFVPGAFFSKAETDLSRTAFYDVGPVERGQLSSQTWTYSRLEGLQCRPPAHQVPHDREFNVYALFPFTVDRASESLLYINAAKCFTVILDDKTLLTKDVFKVQEDPTAVLRLTLKPGYHRLLVKIHSGRGEDGVHMALLDALGNALPVTWQTTAPEKGGAAAGFSGGGEWRGTFLDKFPPSDPRFSAFSALWYRWRGDVARGRLTMEGAASEAPACLAWNLWVARMYLLEADDLPVKIAQSRAEKAVDASLGVDPGVPLALFFKAMMQSSNSDGDENLATLAALVEKAPSDPRWFLALAGQFQGKGWIGQARSVLESASSYHPECESVESAWIGFCRGLPDLQGQAEAIHRLEGLRNADMEWEDYFRNTRRWDELHKLLEEEQIRYGDMDHRLEEELASLEIRSGDYASARKRLADLAALDPADTGLALQLARACFLSGDREAGFRAWETLKETKPDAFQVDLARWATGSPMPFQDAHLTLEQVIAEDTSSAPDAAPSSLLLDQMFTRVEKDGSSMERYHGVIRINDKEGVDREGEQSLPGQVVLMLRTVKPDGRILEPEEIPDKDTISMQGLEAGDIIEYEYITLKRQSGVKPGAYVTAQVYLFQDIEKPFHRTQWRMEWPDSIPMKFHEQNLPAPCRMGSSGGTSWRDWDYRDMPRIAPEPDTPNKQLYIPLVEAVGGIEWKDLGRYLKEGITGAFQVTPEIEARYREAVAGKTTPAEKMDGIVRYLLKEVDSERSAGWQDPTQTLLTRQGSRIPVAAAFLSLAHIPYDILVAETVPDRVNRENLPRLGQFSTPVLRANLPSGAVFLTLSSPYRDPYILPWYLQGAKAMEVSGAEPWVERDIPADFRPWSSAVENEVRELTPEGDLRIEHTQVLDPEASESLRGSLRRMDKDQWRQAVEMSLSKQHGNLDLLDFQVGNMEDPFKPVRWDYTILVHGFANSDGGRLTVSDPLPALRLGQAMASLRERKLPLTTGGPIFLNQRFTLTLPQGSRADFPMPVLEEKTPFGSYRIRTVSKGDTIEVERVVQMPFQVVWPSKYGAFSSFLQKADEAESGQLVVAVP